jgi:hypothetical protein
MYAGFVIAVVFTGVVIWRLINKTHEGLSNKDDDETRTTIQEIVTKLKKESELLEDTLMIDRHRTDYEDMFLALEDYCNLALIQMLSVFSNNPSLEKASSKTMIEGINHVNSLKTTLNDVMDFMDRKSSKSTKTTKSSASKSFFGNN